MGPLAGSSTAFADAADAPSDVSPIVDAGYAEWQSSLGARQECSTGVSIVFDRLEGRRGEYRVADAVVVIDPFDSVAGLEAVVVHELSHHTFLACGAFADDVFKDAFYAAQDIPVDRGWFDYSHGWSQTPAEQFAEVMATAVVGSSEGGIAVSGDAVSLVTRWLSGAPLAVAEESYEPQPYAVHGISTAPADVGGVGSPAAPEASPSAAPATSVTIEMQGVVLEAVVHKAVAVFWLNTWRAFGPV